MSATAEKMSTKNFMLLLAGVYAFSALVMLTPFKQWAEGQVRGKIYTDTTVGSGLSTMYVAEKEGFVYVQGKMNFGYAETVMQYINKSNAHTLVLESVGGYLSEAHMLSSVLRVYGVNTHVGTTCESACGLVFMSGKNRTAASHAKFGFHNGTGGGASADMCNTYQRHFNADFICDAIFRTASSSMTYMTSQELKGTMVQEIRNYEDVYPFTFNKVKY